MTRSNNEIPVRRRGGGIPWWAWLIGLALLGLLLYSLLQGLGNNNNAGASPSTNAGTPATSPAGSPAGSDGAASPSDGLTSPEASGSPASSRLDLGGLTVVIPAPAAGLAA